MVQIIIVQGARFQSELPIASRQAIENQIEQLISLLDAIDGNPDLEPEEDLCPAGDDGCGFHRAGWSSGWGASEEEEA
jgi:hypothetical protein